jgi:hypothetical protein
MQKLTLANAAPNFEFLNMGLSEIKTRVYYVKLTPEKLATVHARFAEIRTQPNPKLS